MVNVEGPRQSIRNRVLHRYSLLAIINPARLLSRGDLNEYFLISIGVRALELRKSSSCFHLGHNGPF